MGPGGQRGGVRSRQCRGSHGKRLSFQLFWLLCAEGLRAKREAQSPVRGRRWTLGPGGRSTHFMGKLRPRACPVLFHQLGSKPAVDGLWDPLTPFSISRAKQPPACIPSSEGSVSLPPRHATRQAQPRHCQLCRSALRGLERAPFPVCFGSQPHREGPGCTRPPRLGHTHGHVWWSGTVTGANTGMGGGLLNRLSLPRGL